MKHAPEPIEAEMNEPAPKRIEPENFPSFRHRRNESRLNAVFQPDRQPREKHLEKMLFLQIESGRNF